MTPEAPPPIHRASTDDAETLASLGATTFVESFGHLYAREDLEHFLARNHTPEAWEKVLADEQVAVWLAGSPAGPPAGFAVAGPCKLPIPDAGRRAGEIRQLYLRREYQRQQLGTRLLIIALEWLTIREHAPIYVGVWSENLGARRLYDRFGFIKVGEYDFPVGRHLDREFILRLRARSKRAGAP